MKIAVLGAGNMGCAIAADLTKKGHEVTLIKTSSSIHNENFKYLKTNNGHVNVWKADEEFSANIACVTDDLSLVSSAELVIIAIMTNYHEGLIKKIEQYLRDGQIVMIVPGYLSTAYILKHCPQKALTIVEGESSPIDCRISGPGHIRVGFRNVRNPIGVYPKAHIPAIKDRLDSLQYSYVYLSSVIEAALHNPNLIVHSVGAIMSIPRIEKAKGDYCMYREAFTPSVWRILESLDDEKMQVLGKLWLPPIPYVEACKQRNSFDDEKDAKEVFFEYAASPYRAKGPVKVDTRYISEDVPQGLVMLEALGQRLNIKTPICTALIELAGVALGRNMRAEGRTLERLGIENVNAIIKDSPTGYTTGLKGSRLFREARGLFVK